MRVWITVSIIALIPMILHLPRFVTLLRVKEAHPDRFSGAFMSNHIVTLTGWASDVGKRSEVHTSGQISSTLGANMNVQSVQGSVSSTTTILDNFFLTAADGTVQPFQLTDFDAQVGNDHVVSVVWTVRKFRKSGRYIVVRDHTTGQTYFSAKAIRKSLTFPFPSIYVAVLILTVLPLPVVLFFGLTAWAQEGLFKRSGVTPLVASLDAGAREMPQAQPSQR
jgi:hypothetical protein